MRRSIVHAAASATAIVAAGVALAAFQRTQQPQPPQQRLPVFRGESVLVTVDAYPQRDGHIVEGLKAQDFQVLEDGKAQAIEEVEFVRVEPAPVESERRDPNSVGEMLQLAADPHNRVFVVFLDQLHVTIGGSFATRRPMVDALNHIIGPNDLFGIMTQNTDARALTLGRRLLSVEGELSKYWNWGERQRSTLDPADPLETSLKNCFEYKPPKRDEVYRPWYVFDNGQRRLLYQLLIDRRREDRTLTAMEALVDRMGGLRDARTVALVVTEGWRLFREDRGLQGEFAEYGPQLPPIGTSGGRITAGDQTQTGNLSYTYLKACQDELVRLSLVDEQRRLDDIIRRANRANVSFYPVNPSGLTTFDTPQTYSETVVESREKSVSLQKLGPPDLMEDGVRLRARADAMHILAENTDGIAILNTNDIGAGLKRIVDDVSAYYLLRYYSTNTAHDGRFRRIDVKTSAKDLQLRARRGYYAPSDKSSRDVRAATPAGLEPPRGLDAALAELTRLNAGSDLFARGAIAGDRAVVVVELSSSRAGAAPWNAGAEVRIAASLADGRVLPGATGRIEANERGVLVSIPVDAGTAFLRVVMKVSAGGETLDGTVELKREAAGLVGDGVLYRGRPAATSPLRPVADLQFRRTERVHAEWTPAGELDQRSARLLSRTGQPLPIPLAVTERDVAGRKILAADLNLAPLAAGDYVLELTAGRGGEVTTRLLAFRVIQ